MWLRAPEAPNDVLWEGMLEPETEEAVERTRQELDTQRNQADIQEDLRNLPVVSIGRPETWSLLELFPHDKMPHLLRTKLQEADFYLVRTVCSFRPMRESISISWARFNVRLLPNPSELQPIAYDLYPKEVFQEVKHQIKISLNPTLNFQELQAGVGGVEFGLEYPELQPVISAVGIGENTVAWDYEEARGIRLQGSKTMHLLIEAPKGMPSAWASLDLVADVLVRNSYLPTLMPRSGRQEAARPLEEVPLW